MRNGGTQIRPAAWLIPLLVALLALALPAVGEAAGPGGIGGTVTAVGGTALAGVRVCAEEQGGLEEFVCGQTAFDGSYEITGLPAGQYIVSFSPSSEQNYVRQYYDGAATYAAAMPVTVGVGVTPGIDAELAKGAKISGVVSAAATALPVGEAFVCAYSAGAGECARTNVFGAYVIQGLPAGAYEVEAFPTGSSQNLTGATYPGLVAVPAGGEVAGIDIALPPGGQVEGTVRLAATGAPLKGVDVCITEASETWPLACLESPASGRYRFTGLWAGAFKVVFSPEASELEEGEELEIAPDAYPTQWWNGQPTFAAATPIGMTVGGTVGGIDGSLGPGPVAAPSPPPAAPPATVVVKPKPKPKPLTCKRAFVKKKVKGKARCVKRHKPKRHHRKHHPKPRAHAARSR